MKTKRRILAYHPHCQSEILRRELTCSPLPADTSVLEDNSIQCGNVKNREDGDESSNDSPEQELIPPNIVDPLREISLGAGLHAEE